MKQVLARLSGIAGIAGGVVLAVSGAWSQLSGTFGFSREAGGSFAEVAGLGVALSAVALLATYLRARRRLGLGGHVGFGLAVTGGVFTLIAVRFWGGLGGTASLGMAVVGVALYGADALRTESIPRGAAALFLLSVASGVAALAVDHPAGVLAARSALAANLGAMTWIGTDLWRSPESLERPRPRSPARSRP